MSSNQDKSPRPVTLKYPLNWVNWGLTEQAKSLRFVKDDQGNLWCTPSLIVSVDPITGLIAPVNYSPNTFKGNTTAAAGSTTIWTPTTGTKFRLMGGLITITKDAAAAAAFNVTFLDGAAAIFKISISGAALVATGNVIVIPFSFPSNGYLSLAADNLFTMFLSSALTAGELSISCWGTEEAP